MAERNGLAVVQPNAAAIMEDVIAKGDLSALKPHERAAYYMRVCESMGLNPLTKPFAYIMLSGGLTLYATRTATDQLRQTRGVSITRLEAETTPDGLRIVTAYVRDAAGREDSDVGAVNIKGLGGENLANAYMKAITKAKRRATLSICGLGWLDESEIESVPAARVVPVDHETGEILDAPQPERESMTPAQKKKIWAQAQDLGMDLDRLHAFAGVASLSALSKQEASDLITRLDAAIGEEMAASQSDHDGDAVEGEYVEAPMFAGSGNPGRYTK